MFDRRSNVASIWSVLRTQKIITWLLLTSAALIALVLSLERTPNIAQATAPLQQTTPSCGSGVSEDIAQDTTWSGDVYVDYYIKVENGATLTIEPGTNVIFCGEYSLRISNGNLIAEGTADTPITFKPNDPATHWNTLLIGGTASTIGESRLAHMVLEQGGGNDPTANQGALYIDAYSGTTGSGPVVEHVTIEQSGAYGMVVEIVDSDLLDLSHLTINNSTRAPMRITTAAIGNLGEGNSFSDNGKQTIEVTDETIYDSQRWRDQGIPYELLSGFAMSQRESVTETTELVIDPGTDFLLHQNANILVRSQHLIAIGTPDNPITFDAVNPDEPWKTILFGGTAHNANTSRLRYVELKHGGGEDDLTDPEGGRGMLHIKGYYKNDRMGPIIDNVTIRNSSSYGVFADVDDYDDTPFALSNLTISGSARAPIGVYTAAAKGLGSGHTLYDNADNVIEIRVGTVVGGRMYHSQTWETQAVPYKLVGNPLDVKGTDTTTPTFTIEKGNTILVSPETTIRMGNAGFIAAGTPTAPITITRLDEQSAPWGRLLFKNGMFPESRMEYTNVSYAGGEGAISFDDEHGNLTLDHVQVQHNLQAGILHEGRFMQIKDSTIQFNGVGIKIQYDADALLRRNTISANQEGGLLTYANGDICIDAIHNYWGSPNGPNDTIDTQDACNAATTNDSTGDSVGEGVLYSPWMGSSDEISVQGTSRISADPYWVIADGKQQTTLEITVRDLAGNPLEDKQIEIQATLGTITQPTSLTDEQGVTRAILYSSEVGDAIITARNVTDNTPLAGLAAVHFWRGTGGDTAGLVDSGGVPYASPNLILEGLPFIQGLPMTFRLPMQNTNADPVDVEVSYAVTGLNIGEPFSEVDVVASTIQPGETWDAPGGWIVDVTGHHCVKAFAKVTLPDGTTLQETVNVGPFQVNFDVPKDPCKKTDATKLIPRSAGVSGVRKHTQKLLIQTYLVKECLKQQLTFGNNSSALSSAAPSAERDYQTIVSIPDLTPPQFTVDDTMTAEQVDALNALGTTAAELSALDIAIAQTNQRIQWAGLAQDDAAEARQFAAYRQYQQSYATKLDTLAERIDTLLSVTEGAGEADTQFAPADYEQYITSLEQDGYADDTVSYLSETGMSSELIQAIRQAEIERLQQQTTKSTSFYAFLHNVRDAARSRAANLHEQYDTTQVSTQANDTYTMQQFKLAPMQSTFTVGNPKDSTETIVLRVRPVEMPLDWTYALDQPSPTLAAGESTEVTLTLAPGERESLEGSTVRVAVEGYIGDELIGGVLVQQRTPWTEAGLQNNQSNATQAVYLPMVVR